MQELDLQADFEARHLGPNHDEITEMLSMIGYSNVEELCDP